VDRKNGVTPADYGDYLERRLQGDDLDESKERKLLIVQGRTPYWGCDDTLLECRPQCTKMNGLTISKVAVAECADKSFDECSCPCYYDAHWTCDGDDVVCKASMHGTVSVVGDLICTSRGTPKPAITSFEERVAFTCEKQPTARGAYPVQQCMDNWSAKSNDVDNEVLTRDTSDEQVDEFDELIDIEVQSFAAPAFLVAFFLIAM